LHRAFKQPNAEFVHRLKGEEVGLVMPGRAAAAQGAGASLV
jgi:hypothetical protein